MSAICRLGHTVNMELVCYSLNHTVNMGLVCYSLNHTVNMGLVCYSLHHTVNRVLQYSLIAWSRHTVSKTYQTQSFHGSLEFCSKLQVIFKSQGLRGSIFYKKKTVWQLPVGQGLPKLEASEALRISALDYSSWTFVFIYFSICSRQGRHCPKGNQLFAI